MAKRNYRKSSKKIQPAVMTMQFNLTNNKDATYAFDTIDLSKCASALNRRFYRQGLQWAVAGFTFFSWLVAIVTITAYCAFVFRSAGCYVGKKI